jgi:hypothetical protein
MQLKQRHLAVLAALAFTGAAFAQTTTFEVNLTGNQEVPLTASTGTGAATVTLNTTTGAVTVTGTYTGLGSNMVAQHIHVGPSGANGPVKIGLIGVGTTNGTIAGAGVLAAADIAVMLAGGMYINVHSTNFPGGEIRGQIGATQLYYKFERGLGNRAVNYGNGGLGDGTIVQGTTPANAWVTPGRYGRSMLTGSNNSSATDFVYCDTGWTDAITGSISVHWGMKERNNPGTAISYMWGRSSFRCFTNGVASTGIWLRSWGGPDLKYPTTFQAESRAANGVCIGLVIDAANLTAQWYRDGVALGAPVVIPNGVNVPAFTSGFNIGKDTSDSTTSVYDTDEFFFSNRALSAAEMAALCNAATAGCGPIGESCGIEHGCDGGPPKLGNSNYRLTAQGPTGGMNYLLVFGVTRVPDFNMGIAFPHLSGCRWYTAFHVQLAGNTTNGQVLLPLAIPNMPSLAGVGVDSQMLGAPTSGPIVMSNAISTEILN